ncbi:MAG: sigma-70 family RNA polymerase sigma factor [Erysipelotrichaceae bacterium]|nr:sigma-70 family RNA polymerase sigma factor [Erysipelotrichaceae bacterium]
MENQFDYINELMPFYLRLLTERQQEILKLYFYEDLSLTEIAENLSISRNGVYDTLKKAEKSLKEYEDKLQLSQESALRLEKYEKIRSLGYADVNKIINELIQREEEYE